VAASWLTWADLGKDMRRNLAICRFGINVSSYLPSVILPVPAGEIPARYLEEMAADSGDFKTGALMFAVEEILDAWLNFHGIKGTAPQKTTREPTRLRAA
jgi:hypothetical protein